MVIDAKYKMKYQKSHIHADMRQVSGYARLNKVIKEIKSKNDSWNEDHVIPCLIVYPHLSKNKIPEGSELPLNKFTLEHIRSQFEMEYSRISAYHKMFKLGIELPVI